jgi:hypothetical protein
MLDDSLQRLLALLGAVAERPLALLVWDRRPKAVTTVPRGRGR